MDDRLFNLILFLGLGTLLALELRSPAFRAGSFQKNVRALRNWSFLAGAVASSWMMRLISEEAARHITPLFSWSDWKVVNAIACILTAELIGYFSHWIKHANGWLWRFHFQHHRDSTYDIWLVAHTHGLEVIVSGTIMSTILVLLGFSPASMNVYFLFYALATTYHHSAFDYSLGWLDKLIISPAYHRLHHSVEGDGNFGNTLTLWDVVFRTARWPASRHVDAQIGLGDAVEPYGFRAEMTYFLER